MLEFTHTNSTQEGYSLQNLRNEVETYFKNRFGVKKKFWKDYNLYEKGNSIWITSKELDPREDFIAGGIRTLRYIGKKVKPTTYILQILNGRIKKNVKHLNEKEVETLILEREPIEESLDPGYIALKINDKVIGCGMMNHQSELKTQISKNRTKELQEIL